MARWESVEERATVVTYISSSRVRIKRYACQYRDVQDVDDCSVELSSTAEDLERLFSCPLLAGPIF